MSATPLTWVGYLLLAFPAATFLIAIHHPRVWRWLLQQERRRSRGLCALIALERILPLLIFNPYLFVFVYLPEYTTLDIFDSALPLIHFKQNHYLLAILTFLINYLICLIVLRRVVTTRQRRLGRS